MPPISHTTLYTLYGLEALIAALLLVLSLYLERRAFKQRGKGRGWMFIRLALLPFALLTAAVVVLPARALGGPEALGLFYIGLFAFGPLVWFGLHWLLSKLLIPSFTSSEVLFLAASPLGFILAAVMLGHMAQSIVWSAAVAVGKAEYAKAQSAPAPYALVSARRYEAPGGVFTSTFWQSTIPLRIERIDLVTDKYTAEDVGRGGSDICQEPGGIRWVRAEGSVPASLRIYWRDDERRLYGADLVQSTTFVSTAFKVGWPDDPNRFILPEAFPRMSVSVGYKPPDREMQFSSYGLEFFKPGEDFTMNCFPQGWRSPHRVDGIALAIQRPGSPLIIRAVRTEEDNASR